jgi:hypothetical protein
MLGKPTIIGHSPTSTKYTKNAESGYTIICISATHYRSDSYNVGKPSITMYDDREAGNRVVLLHAQKGYVLEKLTPTDGGDQRHIDMMDPRKWIQKYMSCKYNKLGQKTVDGVPREGIETTEPDIFGESDFRIDSLKARLWVEVGRGLPVLFEGTFKGEYSGESIMDQFQWDVELDESIFEPNIPPDYEQM